MFRATYFSLILLLETALFGLGPVHAAPGVVVTENLDEKPMRFVRVRSDSPGCEPLCPEWISAQGRIVFGTAKKLEAFLAGRDLSVLPIVLASQGGEWEEAISLGEIVREHQLDVAVARTQFAGCGLREWNCDPKISNDGVAFGRAANSVGLTCGSACVLVLASGVNRVAGTWSGVGIIQISNALTTEMYEDIKKSGRKLRKGTLLFNAYQNKIIHDQFTSIEIKQDMKKKIGSFLSKMGVSSLVIDIMVSSPIQVFPNSQIEVVQYISQHDRDVTKLVTSLESSDIYVSSSICKLSPPAGNCISR